MDYSIKPSEDDLRNAREAVNTGLNILDSFFDLESGPQIRLIWMPDENFHVDEKGASGEGGKEEIIITYNTEAETWRENIQAELAKSLGEIEFLEAADYEDTTFQWQIILRRIYGIRRAEETLNVEKWEKTLQGEIEHWAEIREQIKEDNLDGETWNYAVKAVYKSTKNIETDQLPKMKRSEVLEAGDKSFGESE